MNNNINVLLNSSAWTLIGIVGLFAVLALITFLLNRILKMNKNNIKKDEKEIVEENLSRYLEDIDDEDIKKQFNDYDIKNIDNE